MIIVQGQQLRLYYYRLQDVYKEEQYGSGSRKDL